MANKAAAWRVDVQGIGGLRRGLKAVGETDIPYMHDAFEDAGRWFELAAKSHAIGGIATSTDFIGVKGTTNTIRAAIRTDHPGARSMEFGRKYWRRNGVRVKHEPGQRARPYYGIIKGSAAIADTATRIRTRISTAISREWDRLGGTE